MLMNKKKLSRNYQLSVISGYVVISDNKKKDLVLFGDSRFDENKNKFILEARLKYIKNSERFSGSLFE